MKTKDDVSEVLWVSRYRKYKREVTRDAGWMKRHGGERVQVTGKRGLWRVRARMPVIEFARFCSIEATREGKEG